MVEEKDAAANGGTSPMTGACVRGLRTPLRVFALLLAGAAIAIAAAASATAAEQTAAAPQSLEKPKATAAQPGISYADGQLRIDVLDSTLADVLTKVAALTGVKIEVPTDASSERMPVVKLGPGPPRQVLASLLSESNLDYLIQASDTDPEKIQSVLLMPREKKGSGTNATELASRPVRSPYSRAVAPPPKPEEVPVDSTVPAQPEIAATDAISVNPPPASTQPDQSAPPQSEQADQSMQLRPVPADQTNVPKTFPVSPPQTLTPQAMNQQLQQMYQQRMQMIQQDRQAVPPVNPGGK